ncbi:MAG: PP2C family serine/threonine-protein phosphatase [Treponema sp.]
MWNVIQCAIAGRGHSIEGKPCQDKTFSLSKDNCTIAALADGAGSVSHSHFGAENVVHHICTNFTSNFDFYFQENDGTIIKKDILSRIVDSLKIIATEYNCMLKDLASTLLVVAIKEENYILLHIGDGVIGYAKNGELKVASKPNNGEFVNTTVFTTSENALYSMKLIKGSLGAIDGFVLMSDGSETTLYQKKENRIAPAIKSIMNMMQIIPLEKIQSQLNESFKQLVTPATQDDCSIAIAVKENKTFCGYANMSIIEKYCLLQLDYTKKSSKKRFQRYNALLFFLETEKSLSKSSTHIHLKPKYTKRKYINKLLELNLIEKNKKNYKTILILEKTYK